jgi:hypothetical protein
LPWSACRLAPGDKQATDRDICAELIRRENLSLSPPTHSSTGNLDNLLSSQVSKDKDGSETSRPQHKGELLAKQVKCRPVITEEDKAQRQKR